MTPKRHFMFAIALVAGISVLAVAPAAQAWWRGGVVFGVAPYYYAPPYYYPPPVIYAPPYPAPAYYPPPGPPAQSCQAGPYVCPLSQPTPAGSPCSCPTETGRVGGRSG